MTKAIAQMRDNPRRWTNEFAPQPAFDVKAFNDQIDQIVGRGILRVVWGAAEEIEQATSVNRLGAATGTVKVGRYQTLIKGTKGRVRIRRWILEQYHAPEVLGVDELFVKMPTASGLYVPPELAAMKQRGLWKMVDVIADHSKCDPVMCASTDYYCFGDYAAPSGFDLDNLRRQTREKERNEHRLLISDSFEDEDEN